MLTTSCNGHNWPHNLVFNLFLLNIPVYIMYLESILNYFTFSINCRTFSSLLFNQSINCLNIDWVLKAGYLLSVYRGFFLWRWLSISVYTANVKLQWWPSCFFICHTLKRNNCHPTTPLLIYHMDWLVIIYKKILLISISQILSISKSIIQIAYIHKQSYGINVTASFFHNLNHWLCVIFFKEKSFNGCDMPHIWISGL